MVSNHLIFMCALVRPSIPELIEFLYSDMREKQNHLRLNRDVNVNFRVQKVEWLNRAFDKTTRKYVDDEKFQVYCWCEKIQKLIISRTRTPSL